PSSRRVTVCGPGIALPRHPGTARRKIPHLLRDDPRGRCSRAAHRAALAGLPVARLRLPGRPGAHQSAGALPGLQPVAEVGAGDVLELPDVVLEIGQHGLALRPGQRLAMARVLLQEALQGPGQCRPRLARGAPPGRGGATVRWVSEPLGCAVTFSLGTRVMMPWWTPRNAQMSSRASAGVSSSAR